MFAYLTMEFVDMSTCTKTGRPAGEQFYVPVSYAGKEYVVGFIMASGEQVTFVFDGEDFPKVYDKTWHRCANNYVSSGVIVGGKKKELFLHNLVMVRPLYTGKGPLESVDHINRIGFDNRKENLRIVSQSEQNFNQKSRKRIAALPADSGLTMEDIPRHIWYIKANGAHGDRFAIEFKSEGITWKTTSSKTVPLRDKLIAAKAKLQEFYTAYPHLNPEDPTRLAEVAALRTSYDAIVGLATV
jgi:hypothetical protein